MNFKGIVEQDNKSVFLNCKEFAEKRTIKYDGGIYENIPVVLTKIKQSKMNIPSADKMEGIYSVSVVIHFSLKDFDGVIPEKNQRIRISDGAALGVVFYQNYKIVTVIESMGLITLELEALDE